jgi:DNA polymerase-1
VATARSESAAELLCAELSADGLPMDRTVAEQIVATHVGPRPRDERPQRRELDHQGCRPRRVGPSSDRRASPP